MIGRSSLRFFSERDAKYGFAQASQVRRAFILWYWRSVRLVLVGVRPLRINGHR